MLSCQYRPMAKLIPFRPRRNRSREAAAYVLALSARFERSKGGAWTPPLDHRPERLGNLLQLLIAKRPAIVFAIESLVVEMLAQIDPED